MKDLPEENLKKEEYTWYTRIKSSTLQYAIFHHSLLPNEKLRYRYFTGSAQKGKNVLKFQKFSKNLCKTVPFSLQSAVRNVQL